MPARDLVLVMVVVLAWGSNFTAMKIGLQELPPLLFVGLRFAILLPLLAFFRRPAPWWTILGVGAFINTGQFAFLFSAMRDDATAGLASLILQSQAPITIILAAIFFRERVRGVQTVGIALACAGLALFGIAGGGNVTLWGLVLILTGALSWACGNLVLRKSPGVSMTALFVWASLVPPLPMLGLSMAWEGGDPVGQIAALSLGGWLAVAYVAFISTVLGFSIWGNLLSRHPGGPGHPFCALDPGRGPVGGRCGSGRDDHRRRGAGRPRGAVGPDPRRSGATFRRAVTFPRGGARPILGAREESPMPPARFALILGLVIAAGGLTVALAAWAGPVAGSAGMALVMVIALIARAALGRGA
ncbi:Permease of the drug/metabolite transporter (DMT) superfamily [Roseibacterium elongatum DSM 19469]|uniref:Permease of the drug/metabolite transporter (DMT) superfamily n=1 Tax=Roseicyclus elongatus DSM 19469 TaxID=1294273 RepID=W8S3V0_9RHOB|nr:EamA family transporter [Roseibacterium elongatum]AHM04887.1 Permease of the drug/metabolite transporter (DMT) superfamily [Roseibacterium elongatum DSM 19469]